VDFRDAQAARQLADGKELWSYDLGTEIYSSPAVAEERIVVTAGDGRVCAFGAAPAREAERGGGER
jgi:hypothetical protein